MIEYNKDCPKCKSEMVEQSYVDPNSEEKVSQLQCFKCGYSENVDTPINDLIVYSII